MLATLDGAPVVPERLRALALLNYGHFTSMRVEETGVRGLDAHLDRLVGDCARLFDVELDRDRVRHLLRYTLSGVPRPVLARVTVFDAGLQVGDLAADAAPSVLVTLREAHPGPAVGTRLSSAVYQRELPEVKHVGLFGAMRLRRDAQRGGADDVLFVGPDGSVCETSVANIGFIDGDRVVWPRADRLPGVTMRLLDGVVPTVTEPVHLTDLAGLTGAFVTNAAVGIHPVVAIDDVTWPTEPAALHRLRRSYAAIRPEPL